MNQKSVITSLLGYIETAPFKVFVLQNFWEEKHRIKLLGDKLKGDKNQEKNMPLYLGKQDLNHLILGYYYIFGSSPPTV